MWPRFMYASSFGKGDDYIIQLWTAHATKAQTFVIRHMFPLIKRLLKRKMKINDAGVVRANERISAEIQWVEQRLKEGHTWLAANRFTVADITAASLLAPLACPDEHPVYCAPEFKQIMSEAIDPWRDSPALEWVRQTYRKHRGKINIC